MEQPLLWMVMCLYKTLWNRNKRFNIISFERLKDINIYDIFIIVCNKYLRFVHKVFKDKR